jgi:hypothetical protein
MDVDTRMEARFEPVVFESAFDTSYSNTYAGRCTWQVTWANTKLELRYTLTGGQYVGRLRVTGNRRAVVTGRLSSTYNCTGSTTSIDQTFTVGTSTGYGQGVNVRVRTFDGQGDEYLVMSTGGLPGPSLGGANGAANFLPVQIDLQYTGTDRSGSTRVLQVLTRLAR